MWKPSWIAKVDDLAEAYEWNEKQTSCFAFTKLDGVAKTWYEGLPTAERSWNEWKEELKRAFPSSIGFQHLLRELEARRKKREESIETYSYDKLARARCCKLDDLACIDYIIIGLDDEDKVLSVREYGTPQDLLKCMRRLEERVDDVKKPHSKTATGATSSEGRKQRGEVSGKTKKPRFNDKGEPLCFNSSTYGHYSADCPKPQRKPRCDTCKRSDHESAVCKQKPAPRSKPMTVLATCTNVHSSS